MPRHIPSFQEDFHFGRTHRQGQNVGMLLSLSKFLPDLAPPSFSSAGCFYSPVGIGLMLTAQPG
jgi:hypothetical protein